MTSCPEIREVFEESREDSPPGSQARIFSAASEAAGSFSGAALLLSLSPPLRLTVQETFAELLIVVLWPALGRNGRLGEQRSYPSTCRYTARARKHEGQLFARNWGGILIQLYHPQKGSFLRCSLLSSFIHIFSLIGALLGSSPSSGCQTKAASAAGHSLR